MTSSFLFTAFSKPKPGREREFSDWYEEVHMAEVLGVSGIDSLQRFSLATRQPLVDGGLECPFSQVGLARLSLEPPDFVANLGMGLTEGSVTQSSAMLDLQPWFFEPLDGSSVTVVEGPENRNLLLWFGDAPASLLDVVPKDVVPINPGDPACWGCLITSSKETPGWKYTLTLV